MRVAVLAVVAACSSPSPTHMVDAGAPLLDYTLGVDFDSTRPDMPQVFIDGAAATTLHRVYPDFANPIVHTIELRYADQVLATEYVRDASGDCGAPGATIAWTSISEGFRALVSGDLRYEGGDWSGENRMNGTNTFCSEDGFGIARCGCQATERCAPRITRAQPLFTQMACTPIGPKAAGDPCTLTDDPAGAYDDCGANLVCLAGTCTTFCDPAVPAEYPPETHGC
jgi:hypothetical protein